MDTKPLWEKEREGYPSFPKLPLDAEVDVAIVGGGITGLLCAYLLRKEGKEVIVLEADTLVSGATHQTTAFLTEIIDTNQTDLIDVFGLKAARDVRKSHAAAINLIEDIIKKEKIDCEFIRCSNYIIASDSEQAELIEEEFDALRRAGVKVKSVRADELGIRAVQALEVPNQAKFHPTKFLHGMIAALVRMEVPLYEHSKVKELIDKDDGTQELVVGRRSVRALWTLRSTYHPFDNPKAVLLKKGMYVTYLMELSAPQGLYQEGIYEDLDNPYRYFRVDARETHDRIIIGGEDHRVEFKMNPEKNFAALEAYGKQIFGRKHKVVRRWTGPILEPIDGLALIGEVAPRALIATAFSGNGMTYAGIAALMSRDLVVGRDNPWLELYDPTRMPTMRQLWKKGRDYTEEFFNGAVANALQREGTPS